MARIRGEDAHFYVTTHIASYLPQENKIWPVHVVPLQPLLKPVVGIIFRVHNDKWKLEEKHISFQF